MKILKKTMTSPQKKYRRGHRHKTTLKETGPRSISTRKLTPKVKDKISTTKGIGSNIKSSSTQGSETIKTLYQGNQYQNNYNQGYKPSYQQGAKKYQNNQPSKRTCFKIKDR